MPEISTYPVATSIAPSDILLGNVVGVTHQIPVSLMVSSMALLQEQQASGTNGGASTGSTWFTRVLNTEVFDPDSIVTLASNQFTLQAGTYYMEGDAPMLMSGRIKARFRNITDGTTAGVGICTFSNTTNTSADVAGVRAYFTIASAKVFELQQACGSSNANSFALGAALGVDWAGQGEVEVYSQVLIYKLK